MAPTVAQSQVPRRALGSYKTDLHHIERAIFVSKFTVSLTISMLLVYTTDSIEKLYSKAKIFGASKVMPVNGSGFSNFILEAKIVPCSS